MTADALVRAEGAETRIESPTDPTLLAAIRAVREGRTEAFDEVMIRSEQRVARLAWRILGDAEEVKEALQETFYRVFRSLRRFDERQDFFAWMYTIAVHVCRDLDRRRRRRAFFFAPFEKHVDVADHREPSLEEREQLDLVRRAIEKLPIKARTALVLRDIEELPTETVAQILGSSVSTVRVQISSARAKLRKWVGR